MWQVTAMEQRALRPRFQLQHGPSGRVGAERIALLEAVARHGSITAAAKAVGLSYRGAWDAVQALNALFARPLVQAQVGGREGGAAAVTPAGEALILAFHRIDHELAHIVGQLEQHLADEGEPLDRLAWRLGMKTSARNQLSGVVETVTPGAVNSEVAIRIGDGTRIVAVITRESVTELGLAPGRAALALIKSSLVLLAPGDVPPRLSARNILPGLIVEHRTGAVSDEVVLQLDGGGRIAATITRESGETLDFAVGARAQAIVKASHVIVAVD